MRYLLSFCVCTLVIALNSCAVLEGPADHHEVLRIDTHYRSKQISVQQVPHVEQLTGYTANPGQYSPLWSPASAGQMYDRYGPEWVNAYPWKH